MKSLRNFMEDVVKNMIDEVLAEMDVCKCEDCKLDITAMALNELPPKYVVTEKGELYSKVSVLQQQFEVDVVAAISKAAEIVSKNPRHSK